MVCSIVCRDHGDGIVKGHPKDMACHVSPIGDRAYHSLTVSDLTPNVGMWWYFFTEMFDHFRGFFLGVFQVGRLVIGADVVSHRHLRPACVYAFQ